MRKLVLNVPLDDDSISDIVNKLESGNRIFQVFINAHKINHFNTDKSLLKEFDWNSTIFSPDGIWIKWYAKLTGFRTKQRFGGVDVIERFSQLSADQSFKLFFLGSTEQVLTKCVHNIKNITPGVSIAGYRNGFFDNEDEVVEEIRKSGANVLFIALPSPRKEIFGNYLFNTIKSLKYVAGVGGAFAIFSGDAKRAPRLIQSLGLEWIYRTLLEPKRLFKRYWTDGIQLIRLILRKS